MKIKKKRVKNNHSLFYIYIMKHILNINDYFLTERLMNVDVDVDMIYDTYFKKDIEEIRSTGKIKPNQFKTSILNTSDLISTLSKKAHKRNPCEIKINHGRNFYAPTKNIISLSISMNAIDFTLTQFNGSLKKAYEYLSKNLPNQSKNYINEFNTSRIKGSIHHELVHWIDDTLHNKHIKKRAVIADETGKDMTRKGLPINVDKLEIQGQIHNVYQLKNEFSDIWNDLSFDDLISLSTTLSVINNELKGDIKKQWKKNLKTRMWREGLLGDNMI